MAKRLKTARFGWQTYNTRHFQETEQYAAMVEALFDRATDDVLSGVANIGDTGDKPFSFEDYPSAKKKLDEVTSQLAGKIRSVIEVGSRKQWLFACKKNDAFLASIMNTSKLSKSRLSKMQDRNLDALHTFQGRKVSGMNLSQRVWKYTKQYREQIEQAIDVGLGEGRSAQALARDVKKNLKEPNRLFRRVRDKRGNLVLSKNARAFHPGQGVYRSSVRNAQRLTRSEINMAYRESDFLRWQQLDFVVGIEIRRSNHDPLCKCKLCERLVGRYPKTFKFVGFHPQCMCYAVPILMDDETFDQNQLSDLKAALYGKEYKKQAAKNEVTDVPQGMKDWVRENKKKQANWSSTPYFIRDNFKDGQLSEGFSFATSRQSYENDPIQLELDTLLPSVNAALALAAEWNFQTSADMLRTAYDTRNVPDVKKFIASINDLAKYWQGRLDSYISKANGVIAKAKSAGVDVTNVETVISDLQKNKGSYVDVSTQNAADKVLEELEKAIAAAERAKAGIKGIHPALRSQYDTNEQVDETFREINKEFTTERWFEHGDLRLKVTYDFGVNGQTDMYGKIELRPERLERVKSALGKICAGKASEITFDEADAMATFWHEITHNRNVPGNMWSTTVQTREMELANEYIARHSLSEFYAKLGVAKMPFPEFTTYRASTGYNRMVCNYQYVVKRLGLDEAVVIEAVRKHLFTGKYDDQRAGLVGAWEKAGIKLANGKKATKLASLFKMVRDGYSETTIEKWLVDNGYVKPLPDDMPEPL